MQNEIQHAKHSSSASGGGASISISSHKLVPSAASSSVSISMTLSYQPKMPFRDGKDYTRLAQRHSSKSSSHHQKTAYTSEQEINKYFVQYLVIAACHLIEATASVIAAAVTEDIPPNRRENDDNYLFKRELLGIYLTMAPWSVPINFSIKPIINCFGSRQHSTRAQLCNHAQNSAHLAQHLSGSRLPRKQPSVIEKILADNRLREVCFNGSSNLGRQMGRLSDYYLKPSELEAS
ncbi:hypothetical protein E3P91_03460 [Wallemia ichthyophaga]|nr:hypothetical protein E3P91_03460 [Wallemia ichthyophaga]